MSEMIFLRIPTYAKITCCSQLSEKSSLTFKVHLLQAGIAVAWPEDMYDTSTWFAVFSCEKSALFLRLGQWLASANGMKEEVSYETLERSFWTC